MSSPSVQIKKTTAHFHPTFFQFLRDLKDNNNREWFSENKHRYESEVKEPMLRFITDFGVNLRKISSHFTADPRPVGGSMFRIYRDTRFSKDKTPYKTIASAHFPHQDCGKDVHAPGFYLHLEPDHCMGGAGLWQPDGPSLKKVRDQIIMKTKEWKAIGDHGIVVGGDTLKRPPVGYDVNHPFIEDLKRKDFFMHQQYSEHDVCASSFLEQFTETCRSATPLMAFLTKALNLAF